MKNFRLKKGVAPFRVSGSTIVISNKNITDKIALEVIKRFPAMENRFDFEVDVEVIEPKVEAPAEKSESEPVSKPAPKKRKKRNKK